MTERVRRRKHRPVVDVYNHQQKLSARFQDTRRLAQRFWNVGTTDVIDRGEADGAVIGASLERQLTGVTYLRVRPIGDAAMRALRMKRSGVCRRSK